MSRERILIGKGSVLGRFKWLDIAPGCETTAGSESDIAPPPHRARPDCVLICTSLSVFLPPSLARTRKICCVRAIYAHCEPAAYVFVGRICVAGPHVSSPNLAHWRLSLLPLYLTLSKLSSPAVYPHTRTHPSSKCTSFSVARTFQKQEAGVRAHI